MLKIKPCIFGVSYFFLPFARQSFVGKSTSSLANSQTTNTLLPCQFFDYLFQLEVWNTLTISKNTSLKFLLQLFLIFTFERVYSKWQILCIFKDLWAHCTKTTDSESYCKEKHHFFKYIQLFSDGEINSGFWNLR